VFSIIDGELNILLIQRRNPPFRGQWAFPGGFVEDGERLEDAARRELQEETGLTVEKLDQLAVYGDPGRDPRGQTISIIYWTVVDEKNVTPQADDDAAAVGWFPAMNPPPLAFDHEEILRQAIRRFRATVEAKNF
jgi:8-oxo-dGTP diphosphatase